MRSFILFTSLKLVAILILVFFAAMILVLDLVVFQQIQLLAGAVTWAVLLGLIYRAEDQAELRLVMCEMREG